MNRKEEFYKMLEATAHLRIPREEILANKIKVPIRGNRIFGFDCPWEPIFISRDNTIKFLTIAKQYEFDFSKYTCIRKFAEKPKVIWRPEVINDPDEFMTLGEWIRRKQFG